MFTGKSEPSIRDKFDIRFSWSEKINIFFRDLGWGIKHNAEMFWFSFKRLFQYKTAIVGMAIITLLIGISIFTVITIPYQEAVGLWRGEGNIWAENPQKARPAWINFFLENDLPRKHRPGFDS